MLDRLLGRAALKERIATLEEEKHHLERRFEAESERRADAVTARQEAEERVNRLEDRLEGLEGRLEQITETEETVDARHRTDLRGNRLRAVLDRLQSVETGPEGALSAMVHDEVPTVVSDALGDHATLIDRLTPCLVYTDDVGMVAVALRPPLTPDPFDEWAGGFRLERDWFLPTGAFSLALVRGDTFALGRYEGSQQVAFEGFRSDVKEQHSKGGFSQRRFERIRDEQIRDHLDDCAEVLAEVEGPLYVVGQKEAIREFRDRADATRTVDATGAPAEALDEAFDEFWTTRFVAL